MRRFYAPPENFAATKVTLNAEETKHLRDVLRLRAGEKVSVFDGVGNEFLCEIERIEKQKTELKILEKVENSSESSLNLTLAIALLKGEKFDLVVQKATEIGVNKIVPLMTKRADVKVKDAREGEKKLERWRRISLEAAKQCGSSTLLQIVQPIEFGKFVKNSDDVKILFSERDGESFENIKTSKSLTAIVGSEGGWEDSEIEFAKANGVQIITLGGRILRAETAGIVIPALLQNHFGDLS